MGFCVLEWALPTRGLDIWQISFKRRSFEFDFMHLSSQPKSPSSKKFTLSFLRSSVQKNEGGKKQSNIAKFYIKKNSCSWRNVPIEDTREFKLGLLNRQKSKY